MYNDNNKHFAKIKKTLETSITVNGQYDLSLIHI